MLSDRDYTKAPFRQAPPRANDSVLKPLLLINVVVYIINVLTESYLVQQGYSPLEVHRRSLNGYISLDFGSVMSGQIWRLGTHMFAHGGFWHIAMNMYALWLFGTFVERRIGGHKFLRLYFVSGLVGATAWLLFNMRPIAIIGSQAIYPSVVGASGAVFGVLVSAALLEPNYIIVLLFPPIPMKLKTFAFVYGFIEVVALFNQRSGNIAHLAHVGGLLGGYLYIRWIFRKSWGNVSRSGPGVWHMPKRKKPRWNLFGRGSGRPTQSPPPKQFPGQGSGDPMKEIDSILDKIGKQGLSSLTDRERRVLQQVREKLKKKH